MHLKGCLTPPPKNNENPVIYATLYFLNGGKDKKCRRVLMLLLIGESHMGLEQVNYKLLFFRWTNFSKSVKITQFQLLPFPLQTNQNKTIISMFGMLRFPPVTLA